jgi:hypothetical protein
MAVGAAGRAVVARTVGWTLLVRALSRASGYGLDEVRHVVDDPAELQREHEQQ